jgi:tetratricopeptide (TPR) repeat protein
MATAAQAEPVIEPCLEPMMVVHVRAEGFPLRDEIVLCGADLDTGIFRHQEPTGFPVGLPVEIRRQGDAVEARFKPENAGMVTVRLSANAPERRVDGFPSGGVLQLRLESKPLPEDVLARPMRFKVESVRIPELVALLARTVDHRVEGAERLCAGRMSLFFDQSPISVRTAMGLVALECELRLDRTGNGVIRIDPSSDRPMSEPPAATEWLVLADTDAALAKARTPAQVAEALAGGDARLAAVDPDRIGPEWLDLTLLRARHSVEPVRLAQLGVALELLERLLPMDTESIREHHRQLSALLAERATVLIATGRRTEALADYERAIVLDALEPALMQRAEELVDPSQRPAWWSAQLEVADRLRDDFIDATDVAAFVAFDADRDAIVRSRAAHVLATEAVLAGRYADAGAAWSPEVLRREEQLGADHRRVRDAKLETLLLVELTVPPARFPVEALLPDPPLTAGREPLADEASTLERLFDQDLLDADLAAAISARLELAATPEERARLAVLAAEVALLREGRSGLDVAIGHYRTALEAHVSDDFPRSLLRQRLELLEAWRAGRQ